MKTVWKWILGIVIVLIVLAIGMGAWARQNGSLTVAPAAPAAPAAGEAPQSPAPDHGPRHHDGGVPRTGQHHAGPMMGPHIMPLGGFFGLWMQWIPLAVLALLLFAAYQIGRQAGVNSERAVRPTG